MPTLTIDNEVNITNVNGIALAVTPITSQRIGIVTVTGPKGDKGDAGPAGSGSGGTGNFITQSTLDATGAKITNLSGYVDGNFYLKTNPSGYITGFDSGNYATKLALEQTGQRTWDSLQNNALNISGNLNISGRRAWDDATNLSGRLFATGASLALISGGLEARIFLSGQAADVYSDSKVATTGQANVNYTDVRVATTGQQNYLFSVGIGNNISGNINATGRRAWDDATNLSGNLASTGQQVWNVANNNGINLSGNLNASGRRAWDDSTNLSGNLFATGAAIGNVSGGLDARIRATGQQNYLLMLGGDTNLSGNINSSGRRAWDDVINLSGNLFNTGSNLSSVRVTGSTNIQQPNFTGYGSTLVFQSGNFVFISGAGAGAGGEVNTASNLGGGVGTGLFAQKSSLDLQFYAVQGTGNISLIMAGNVVYFSGTAAPGVVDHGDGINLSGALNSSGRRAWDDATNISGALASTGQQAWNAANNNGINLSGNLFSTGATLIARDLATSGELSSRLISTGANALNNAINISGNLFNTGANLSAVKVTGSSIIQVVNITGFGSTIVTISGGFVIISGSTSLSDAINISGQLASTGGQAWNTANNNGINLSGNLNTSGRRAWDDSTNISGNLNASGRRAWDDATNLSGRLFATGALLASISGGLEARIFLSGQAADSYADIRVASTGQANVNYTDTRVAATGQAAVNYTDARVAVTGQQNYILTVGGDTNLSGNINASGRRAWDDSTNLSGNLNASGRRAWDDATNLSGRLMASGANLSAVSITGSTIMQTPIFTGLGGTLIIQSGNFVLISGAGGSAQTPVDHGDGINLSGNLTQTGSTLWQRDLDISGALATLIAGGGSVVKVTGSAALGTADFTGYGTTLVFLSGNKVFISGAPSSAGGGVPSVNGITNAVTIFGTGNFSAVTIGSSIVISGSTITEDKQILFDAGGFTSGNNKLQWNYITGSLVVGTGVVLLPDNPIAVAGSGDTYIQINLQNRSSGLSAQADYVITADIGTDTSNFADYGINNSRFGNTGYQLYKPLDAFIYVNGGDMHVGTSTVGNVLKMHVGGIQSGNLVSTFMPSGIRIESGVLIFKDTVVRAKVMAKRENLAVIQNGLDSMVLQPALWNRTFTAALPQTTTTQTLFGNTAVNAGTLSTIRDQILGKYTNVVSAAVTGSVAGLGFTTPDFLRGSITGANGFFFTCRFNLKDGSDTTGAYAQPSGSRIFVGMTDQSTSAAVLLNNPAGNRAGLSFCYMTGGASANRFDSTWLWSVKDNTTEFTGSLGLSFRTGAYRFSMYCPPYSQATSGIFYQLDDLIRGSGVTGVMTGYLPIGTTAIGPMAAVCSFSGGARNIGINNIYCEEAAGSPSTNF